MFKKILVAVDGSEPSLNAARVAGDLARSLQAGLIVLVAYEQLPGDLGEPFLHQAMATRTNFAEKVHADAQVQIGEVPGGLTQESLEGPPAEAILSVAETRSVELIVMGTRGLSRLASIIIGSQSQKVVSNAACPVLLVR